MSGRCLSCNKILSRVEMCRKSATTGEYEQLCTQCFKEVEELVYIPIYDKEEKEENDS